MRASPFPLLALAAFLSLASTATAQEKESGPAAVTVTTLAGTREEGSRVLALNSEQISLARGQGDVRLPLADVIVVEFATPSDPPRPPRPDDVALDLWSGEVLHGRLEGGDDESITLQSALLGKVEVALDSLAGVRFLARLAREAEPPDLTSDEADDVVHITQGDRITGSVERFTKAGVLAASGGQKPTLVPYSRVTAVRLAKFEPKTPEGTALDVVLRDGTRLTGVDPQLDDQHLVLASFSGFKARVRLRDVVAMHVRSDAFTYVSDLEPSSLEVKPFWKMAAGDPAVLYAPRMDRAFSGRPLACGGRTWTKGVGVFGGTTLSYDLDGKFKEFRAAAGLDDAAGDLGGVVFEVLVDGKMRWTSGFVRPSGRAGRGTAGPVDVGRIPLKGAQVLTLRVTSGDKQDPYPIQDEADWLGAMLVK